MKIQSRPMGDLVWVAFVILCFLAVFTGLPARAENDENVVLQPGQEIHTGYLVKNKKIEAVPGPVVTRALLNHHVESRKNLFTSLGNRGIPLKKGQAFWQGKDVYPNGVIIDETGNMKILKLLPLEERGIHLKKGQVFMQDHGAFRGGAIQDTVKGTTMLLGLDISPIRLDDPIYVFGSTHGGSEYVFGQSFKAKNNLAEMKAPDPKQAMFDKQREDLGSLHSAVTKPGHFDKKKAPEDDLLQSGLIAMEKVGSFVPDMLKSFCSVPLLREAVMNAKCFGVGGGSKAKVYGPIEGGGGIENVLCPMKGNRVSARTFVYGAVGLGVGVKKSAMPEGNLSLYFGDGCNGPDSVAGLAISGGVGDSAIAFGLEIPGKLFNDCNVISINPKALVAGAGQLGKLFGGATTLATVGNSLLKGGASTSLSWYQPVFPVGGPPLERDVSGSVARALVELLSRAPADRCPAQLSRANISPRPSATPRHNEVATHD